MSIITGRWQALKSSPCELGEGARFVDDGCDGKFIAVDLLAGRLLETPGHPGDALTSIYELGAPLGAVAPVRGLESAEQRAVTFAGREWIAAGGDGIALIDEGATPRWLARPAAGTLPMRMNDGVADPSGRFWAGAMPYDGEAGAGFLVRVGQSGEVRTVLTGLTIPNGPAFSADGTTMYLADTPTGRIMAYEVDQLSGELGAVREFAHIQEGGPDGMTVDAQGHLWSAIWGAGCLLRFRPDGSVAERIEIPASQPTSIALSTRPPYRVLVTSARYGLDHPSPADGLTHIAPVGVAGLPTNHWIPKGSGYR